MRRCTLIAVGEALLVFLQIYTEVLASFQPYDVIPGYFGLDRDDEGQALSQLLNIHASSGPHSL